MDRKHCLVTGANRGLGLELVRQLLGRHCHVVATCRQPGKATALNTLAGEHPGRLHVLPLDVADPRSRAELVRELPLVTDEESLHLLINNAGVLRGGERFGQPARHRRGPASRLGAHRHGRAERRALGGGVRRRAAARYRPPHARRQRVLPRLAGPVPALVKLNAIPGVPAELQRSLPKPHHNQHTPS